MLEDHAYSEYIIHESHDCISLVFPIHALFTGKFTDHAKPLSKLSQLQKVLSTCSLEEPGMKFEFPNFL